MAQLKWRPPVALFTRDRLVRLAAEFAVIFASVVLALIADDWRSGQAERAEEKRVLHLIARDLDEDAANLLYYSGRLEAQEQGAREFFRRLEQGGGGDSLMSALNAALEMWNYRPTFPAYRGLMQSGRLHLIRDDVLRDTILAHFDETVPYLDDLRARISNRHERALELLQRHIAPVPSERAMWPYQLVSSREALAADTEALSALAHAAQARAWLRFRIGEIFVPAHQELEGAVRGYLE